MDILVIGASGFVGRRLSYSLLESGHAVRCLARDPSKIADLGEAGCEVVQGDISDAPSIQRALTAIEAVYVTVHTLSAQHPSVSGPGYMDVEMDGLRNIVGACKVVGIRRLIYVTSMGTSQSSANFWLRERWKEEQFLLNSGLDVTVLRPGQIVGVGGKGFDLMIANAKRSFDLELRRTGQQLWQNIALDDLVYYLVGVLNDPRAYNHAYNVGCDDVLTYDQMTEIATDILGRSHPSRIHLPGALKRAMAPALGSEGDSFSRSVRAILDPGDEPMAGDCTPIRVFLPRPPLSYREAVQEALRMS